MLRIEEQHLILRLPQEEADKLRQDIRNNNSTSMSIGFNDPRTGVYARDGKEFNCSLVDLPTYIETQKTFDNVTFYKSADLHQMIVVQPKRVDGSVINPPDEHSNDGLTPPTKEILTRSFDKFPPPDEESIVEVEQRLHMLDRGELGPTECYELVQIEKYVDADEEEWSSDDDKMNANTPYRNTPGTQQRDTTPVQRMHSSQRLDEYDEPFSSNRERPFTQGRATSGRRPKSRRRTTPQHISLSPAMSPAVHSPKQSRMRTPHFDTGVFATPNSRTHSPSRFEASPQLFPGPQSTSSVHMHSSTPGQLTPHTPLFTTPHHHTQTTTSGLTSIATLDPYTPSIGAGGGGRGGLHSLSTQHTTPAIPESTYSEVSSVMLAKQAELRRELGDLDNQIKKQESNVANARNIILKRKNMQRLSELQQARNLKNTELQQLEGTMV